MLDDCEFIGARFRRCCDQIGTFCSSVSGFMGFMFADLIEHEFAEDRVKKVKEGSDQKEDETVTEKYS